MYQVTRGQFYPEIQRISYSVPRLTVVSVLKFCSRRPSHSFVKTTLILKNQTICSIFSASAAVNNVSTRSLLLIYSEPQSQFPKPLHGHNIYITNVYVSSPNLTAIFSMLNGDFWCRSNLLSRSMVWSQERSPDERVIPGSYWLWFAVIVKTQEDYFLLQKNLQRYFKICKTLELVTPDERCVSVKVPGNTLKLAFVNATGTYNERS